MKRTRLLMAALLLLTSCIGHNKKPETTPPTPEATTATNTGNDPSLTSGEEKVAAPSGAPGSGGTVNTASGVTPGVKATPPLGPALPAGGKKLNDKETKQVLDRMKPIPAEKTDETDFSMRDKSKPVPKTGNEIKAAFPPPEEKPAPKPEESGPLKVLRKAPEGEIALVPEISVTFSQPMMAVTSVEEIAKVPVPVKITPEIKGQWRWIGTKTVLFKPDGELTFGRLPMATEFTVEIPAGTKSATGGVLEKAEKFSFATPPPTMVSQYPYNGAVTDLNPIFFVAFDQKIDPASVLKAMRVTVKGTAQETVLLSAAEVKDDPQVGYMTQSAEPNRWLAFKLKKALPKDTSVKIELGPGLPSAEGPRVTKKSESFSFKTYGPMKFIKGYCDYYGNDCYPNAPIYIEFTNPINTEKFDAKTMVKVSPEIEGAVVSPGGNGIYISGKTKPRTSYKVTLSGKITDIYTQALSKDESFSVKYGESPKYLTAAKTVFVIVDPAGGPNFSVFSTNYKELNVKLYSVTPDDWDEYIYYQQHRYYEPKAPPPGREIVNKKLKLDYKADEMIETRIDLTPGLKDGFGQVFVLIEPPEKSKNYWENYEIYAWVQVTQLGLDAAVDNTDLYGLVTSLTEGKPLEGVELSLYPKGATQKSGKDGAATLALSDTTASLLIAKKGKDMAILPPGSYGGGWTRGEDKYTELRWMIFDDRKMYRPGEEAKIKGWIRSITPGEKSDVAKLPSWVKKVKYTVNDSRYIKIAEGEANVNQYGGFDFTLKLPKTPNLGYTYINLAIDNPQSEYFSGTSTSHYIQIEEFRRPEFEVTAKAPAGPIFVDGKAEITVNAKYYAGGALPNADVTWYTNTYLTSFTPPNRSDYVFGEFVPWWGYYSYGGGHGGYYGGYGYGYYDSRSFSGKTDTAGNHQITLDFKPATPPRPFNVTANATVMDVNRQAFNASASFMVHPASLYVGLKSEKYFVQKGDPLLVDTIVSDLSGNLVKGNSYKVKAVRYDWVQDDKGNIEWKELDPQECPVTSAADAQRCKFATKEGGQYFITAEISDEKGRKNQTKLTMWVAGGKLPPERELKQGQVTLIPDKKEYKSGDTAEILVQAPFAPAEAVLTLRRNGIFKTERFNIPANGSYIAKVKVEDWQVPNFYVQIDLVGSEIRTNEKGEQLTKLPPKPAYATGSLNLSVPPRERALTVKVDPKEKAIEPGASTDLVIEITDSKGKPVQNSEVAIVVVDESVLALSGYRIPDPLSIFYSTRYQGASDHHLRQDVILSGDDDIKKKQAEQPPAANLSASGAGYAANTATPSPAPPAKPAEAKISLSKEEASMDGDSGGRSSGAAPANIQVRADFNALALFAASTTTDSKGKATLALKLPDNLTRYRIVAVAVEGEKRFGMGESDITARLPLMVRPSAPRFLNFGDKFELPVVLQNQTDKPMEVNVAVRATNTSLTEGMGYQVTVPANDRLEVRFPMETKLAGIARFQVGASSGKWEDAAEFSLPVYTPATTEAFATYGTIDKGAIVQPVQAPDNVFSSYGGIEITTSSTAVAELTDAVLYLYAYPYECAEQISSRVISIAALKDVLTAFKAEGLPSAEEMIASMKRDVTRLQSMQNYDGSFGFWQRGDQSWPYLSIHVAHALARAKEKGFDVPQDMFERSKSYLQNVESYYPSWYGKEVRATLSAYALYVRMRLEDVDATKARKLIKDNGGIEKLSLEAIGWLLPVLDKDPTSSTKEIESIRKHLASRVSETAGAAHFTTSYGDSAYLLLHSDRRTDGVLLEAMIGDDPKNDVIPKLVRGLLNHRKAGRWSNTQENAFILLALDKYFNTFESITPDFVARAWLGDTYAGGNEFKGRSTDRHILEIPMAELQKGKAKKDFILQKDGEGRLYYRIGMSYAPTDLKLKPVDYGFTVTREYEAVDHKDDVTRDAKGVWHIKAGASVRVKVTMVAQSRRYHVALVDPLPAGLEAQNPALATTGPVSVESTASYGPYWWWYRTWYEHQNLRDERVEAFTSLLWEGVYTYSYVARATTPGTFVVPPAKAEEMYAPETFGRSASDLVIVE